LSSEVTRLKEWVATEGEPLASKLRDGDTGPGLGPLLEEGPRTAAMASEYSLVIEAIREGYLCHYGKPRIIAGADADLLLLAGDLFYAFGIRRLAALEDLESVGTLSDLIRIAADLHARGDTDEAERLGTVQIMALACGSEPDHGDRLAGLEAGDPEALEGLEQWSRKIAGDEGLSRALSRTREAIDFRPFHR
jgi:hypothetical protein